MATPKGLGLQGWSTHARALLKGAFLFLRGTPGRDVNLASVGKILLAAGLLIFVAACTSVRETQPEETANQQLLMSTAVDKAIARLSFTVPADSGVYLDTRYFESYDEGYAIGAIRAYLLEHGSRLVRKREDADIVVEARAGALSINKRSDFVGLPPIPLPVPLANGFSTPEVPLVKHKEQRGVAKIALTAYDEETGELWADTGPVFGMTWIEGWSVLGVGWREDETKPDQRQREV